MKRSNFLKSSALVLFALFALSGCRNPKLDKDKKGQEMDSTETSNNKTAKNDLNDAQIASIAVTANKVDIAYANIAKKKARNEKTKEFAQTMTKDHQAVIDKAVELTQKLGVTPEDNEITRKLLDMKNDTEKKLKDLSEEDFDKAYIENEVNYHKTAINMVENKLIPNTNNKELKSLLESALPIFKEHLKHAEKLNESLSK